MEELLPQLAAPRAERADAARNRALLLETARRMMAELGASNVTMDGLAERSGLGKGTVFRRFGSRAGIFRALMDEAEGALQRAVLSGEPPLGPGAPGLERLIAYGVARTEFLFDHLEVARATLDGGQAVPAGSESPLSRLHIRMLLREIRPAVTNLDILAAQLTAALDGPLMLHLPTADLSPTDVERMRAALVQGWVDLINQVCKP